MPTIGGLKYKKDAKKPFTQAIVKRLKQALPCVHGERYCDERWLRSSELLC